MLFKRRISLLLSVFLAVTVLFSGCGEEEAAAKYDLSPESMMEHAPGLMPKEFFKQFNADEDKAKSDNGSHLETFELAETFEFQETPYQIFILFKLYAFSEFSYQASLPVSAEADYKAAYEHISLLYKDYVEKYGEPNPERRTEGYSSTFEDLSFYELCPTFEDYQEWFEAGYTRYMKDHFSVNEETSLYLSVVLQQDHINVELNYCEEGRRGIFI